MLFNCLLCEKQYLETVTSFSEEDLECWSGIDWARFRYNITLAAKLTFAVESPMWTVQSVREVLKLEIYLDAFSIKLRRQIARLNTGELDNWYSFYLGQIDSAKQLYLASLSKRGIEPSLATETAWEGQNLGLPSDLTQGMYDLPTGHEDIDYMAGEWFSPLSFNT
jgi:hypothetical protein